MKMPRNKKDFQSYNMCVCSFPKEKAVESQGLPHYNVVAAILRYDNKYLCMQRGASKVDYTAYKFEFPGGKIEPGEERHEALERELREEMDVDIAILESNYLMTVEHTYPDFSITLHCFLVDVAKPDFVLKEHKSFVWLPKEKLDALDWAAADADIIKKLME